MAKKIFLFVVTFISFFGVLGYNVVLNSAEESKNTTSLLEFKIQNAAASESGSHYPDYKNRWLEKGCKAASAICDLSN